MKQQKLKKLLEKVFYVYEQIKLSYFLDSKGIGLISYLPSIDLYSSSLEQIFHS